MKTSRKLWFAFILITLSQAVSDYAVGQTDTDGNMRIYWYNDQVRTNNNDDWGTDEHTWYHYLRENADLGANGTGWERTWCDTRNCGGGCTQNSNNGWDVNPFPGGGNPIPTQWRLRYRYWEDDGGGRCSYNTPWYGNQDDDHDDRTSNYNIRNGCPRGWRYYGWQGASGRNQHNSRTWFSPPRPNYARANGSSGTVTICGPQNVTLSSAGRHCGSSRYRWMIGGTTIGTVSGNLTYYVSSNTTFTVYTRDNNGNSYSSRSVTVNVVSAPTANAGSNISHCSTANITTNGASATGSNLSYAWTWTPSSGTAVLTNASSLNGWVLNPSTNSGSGTLTLTVSSPGCPSATDSRTVTWDRPPTGNAGGNINQCFTGALSSISMSGASMNGYGEAVTGTWSTQGGTGTGTWSQNTSNPAAATFTPTSNSGSRTMRLRVQSTSGECSGNTYDFTRTVTWNRVVVSAGSNVSQCSTTNITTSDASVIGGGYATATWNWLPASGSATLNNNTSITGASLSGLSASGSGILRLTVTGNSPCGTQTVDKNVEWSSTPLGNAGPTLNVCSGSGTAIPMTGATGGGLTGTPTWSGGAALGTWANGGSDPSAWTFTPNGSNPSGSFTATLNVTGIAPCTGMAPATSRVVSWTTPPTGTIGSTVNSCNGSAAVTLTGATIGGSLAGTPFTWSVNSGGGSITGSGTNPATYQYTTPGTTGSAEVQLTVHAGGHCTTDLTFTQEINWGDITASSPATITSCGDLANINMVGTATGQFSNISWSGESGGVWNTTDNFNPSAWIFDPTSTSGNFNATLTVTGDPLSACVGETVTSVTNVDWDVYPTVEAGDDILSCTGTGVAVSMGSTPNAAGQHGDVTWTTASVGYGAGTWTDGGINPDDWSFTPTTVEGYIVAQLEVEGDASCTGTNVTDTRIIQWSAAPVISSVIVTDQTDCNTANGTIVITATGNGPLSYSGDNGVLYQPFNSLFGFAAGTHNVWVTDTVGCEVAYASNPVNINGPVPVVASSVTVTSQNICAGGILGEITITGLSGGGGGPFEYGFDGLTGDRWDDVTSDPMVVDSLAAGSYDVVVRDQFGCMSIVYSRTITEPSPITITNLNITDVVGCGSSGTGAIAVTASGGTGTLTYWLDSIVNVPATNSSWSGLPAGGYGVMVSDANLCNTLANAQINAPWTVTAGDDIYQCGSGTTSLAGEIIGQLPTDCTPTCTSGCGIPGHCGAAATNTNDEWISYVGFNTINNSTGSTTYSNFTGISTTVSRGSTYTLNVTISKRCCGWAEYARVYFDWNRDGDFTDAGEYIDMGSGTGNPIPLSQSVTIPAGAALGTTRMRVYMNYNGYPATSGCGNNTYAEVEDYSVNIVAPYVACTPSFSWSPSGGTSLTASVSTSSTTTYTLTVNDGAGCIQNDDVVVNVSGQTTTPSQVNVDCFGNTNGCVTLNATSGFQPYIMYGPSNTVQVYGGNMRPITVNNTSGTAYTNHPVKMSVPFSAGMRADFGDIRFYDANQNMLDYWIEEVNLSASAIVWVKLANMATGNNTVYMTYGNTALSSVSNGDAVFEFFDDFNSFSSADWTSGTIGSVLGTPWSYYGGNLQGGNISRWYRSNTVFTGARIMESKAYQVAVNCNGFTPLGIWGSNTNGASFLPHRCGNRMYVRDDGGWVNYGNNHPSYRLNEWMRYEIHHNNANANYRVYRQNGTQVLNANRATSAIANERVRIGSRHDSWNGSTETGRNFNVLWDWLFVRPYISVEPTISFGTIQTSDNEFCGLAPGAYTFVVMDVAACSETENVTITEPANALTISSIDVTDTWCYNNTQGELDITVTGGTPVAPPPPYYYSWAGPSGFSSTSEDHTGLGAGIYNVTVADDNGCTASSSATVGTATPLNGSPNFTWIGVTDNLWQDHTNWDCGMPDATSPVIIPAVPIGGNTPIIQNSITGNVLTIELQGNTSDLLDIQNGGLLIIHQP